MLLLKRSVVASRCMAFVGIAAFVGVLYLSLRILSYDPIWFRGANNSPTTDKQQQLLLKLHNVRTLLFPAYRTARSGQARVLLKQALDLLDSKDDEGEQQQQQEEEGKRKKPSPVTPNDSLFEVCPEHWGDPHTDKVYFENIYVTEPCKRIQLEQIVEMLLYTATCDEAEYLVKRIRLIYPRLTIRMAIQTETQCNSIMDHVLLYYGLPDEARTWRQLAAVAKTKYVLVGRNMADFTYYTDIDRMLRALNSLEVDVVGGAVRLEPEGRWYFGCYQSSIRNFTIRLHPGHDVSAQSCAYCDYIASPFLIKRDLLLTAMQHSQMHGVVPFVELFLHGLYARNQRQLLAVVCVDLLFHVHGRDNPRGHGVVETPKEAWTELARRWTIDRVVLPGGVDHQWTCDEVQINCASFKRPGLLLPPCCLRELANCLTGFLTLTSQYNVTSFLVSGTCMGAVKINGGLLPWERDGDLCWDAYKYQLVGGPVASLLRDRYGCTLGGLEYKTKFGVDIKACSKITNNSCLYHQMFSKHWNMDLYGEPILVSNRLWGLKNPTRINLNGFWAITVPNPGRSIRHQYGDNILGHVQHWRDMGQATGWTRYTNVEKMDYPQCPPRSVAHACLSGNYLPHGNIQFQDFPL